MPQAPSAKRKQEEGKSNGSPKTVSKSTATPTVKNVKALTDSSSKETSKEASKQQLPSETDKSKKSPSSAPATAPKTSGKESAVKEEKPKEKLKREVQILAGDKSLTVAMAKKLLGWTEEIGEGKFKPHQVHFTDLHGKRIHCSRNTKNRLLDMLQVDFLMNEILQGNYQLNFENIIIGEWGSLISAQHRLIALCLAAQEWSKNKDLYPKWKTEPTIETTLAFGCSEEDKVVNTVDTNKPRSLRDVIFRSHYFAKMPKAERAAASRRAEFCIKELWHRTGAKDVVAFNALRSHSEAIKFLSRHQRILQCVKHIGDENGTENKIAKIIGTGPASALLYLMGSCTTDREEKGGYDEKMKTNEQGEKHCNWEMWEKACEFWVAFANPPQEDLKALHDFCTDLLNDRGKPTKAEASAIIVKAWNLFVEDQPITKADLKLSYTTKDDTRVLDECPVIGGIDIGKPSGVEST